MNERISVVIRNKNEAKALNFLLKNLTERYAEDVAEIIVVDNLSTDDSKEIAVKYGARFVTIEQFSYGGSANLAAQSATHPIVVIFSAHAFPVSHDFFKQIIIRFHHNPKLAGVRCLAFAHDYKNYINNISSVTDPNVSGLNFSGSAFSKKVWETNRFKDDIRTFEDKEWSIRVIKNGYDIEIAPSIFSYQIKRTKKQQYDRFKNEVVGSYQLWHEKYDFKTAIITFFRSISSLIINCVKDIYYVVKKLFFMIRFLINKPSQF